MRSYASSGIAGWMKRANLRGGGNMLFLGHSSHLGHSWVSLELNGFPGDGAQDLPEFRSASVVPRLLESSFFQANLRLNQLMQTWVVQQTVTQQATDLLETHFLSS